MFGDRDGTSFPRCPWYVHVRRQGGARIPETGGGCTRGSGGVWYRSACACLRTQPACEPEAFTVCPILLTQPAADRWTPLALSEVVLQRVTQVPVTRVLLDRAGHYPLEEPGLTQMADAIVTFIKSLPAGAVSAPHAAM